MPPPESKKSSGSLMAVVLAGMVALCAVALLMFLTLGYFVLVLVIGAGVFGLAAFHYVVWGWWLTKAIQEEEEEEAEQQMDEDHS